jgi:micrococcal nuclease
MNKRKNILVLIFLLILLFVLNYNFLDGALIKFFDESETVSVERVVDGDTVIVEGESVRLLGINSPERGERYYSEAKKYLENLVLNQTVRLEYGKDKLDKYQRILAYLYVGRKNINLELVEEGFANYYFPSGKDKYYDDFVLAWKNCIKENKNLCEKSVNVCVVLKEFDYKNQRVVFENVCDFDLNLKDWEIKDEGRKNFVFENFVLVSGEKIEIKVGEGVDNSETLFWEGETYVWTSSGDTLFLRDEGGGLVLWEGF